MLAWQLTLWLCGMAQAPSSNEDPDLPRALLFHLGQELVLQPPSLGGGARSTGLQQAVAVPLCNPGSYLTL